LEKLEAEIQSLEDQTVVIKHIVDELLVEEIVKVLIKRSKFPAGQIKL